jgi:predicted transposase YbfD/YdcC
MSKEPKAVEVGFLEAFEDLEDPRSRTCEHPLEELMLVALCAVTSGADSWVSVVIWARLKTDWLRQYLPFTNGIASHDTFSRVFRMLDASKFEACFIRWMQNICPNLKGHTIAIDGKSLRGSHDGDQSMIHLVSAWNCGQGLTLGQIKTEAKSNEIRAIPELLNSLDIRQATVTILSLPLVKPHDFA